MPAETYVLRSRAGEPRAAHFAIDYAAELNAAQYAAVSHLEGPVLVVAGAGSGKTRTLVYRVARLVELGIAPSSILLLTFTRRAAEVMAAFTSKSRAEDLLAKYLGKSSGRSTDSRHPRKICRRRA